MLTIAGRVLLAIVFILALGLVAVSEHQPMVVSAAPSPTPRYQIVINPNVRADTFLLDTNTGRVWKPFSFTDIVGDPDLWILQDKADSRAEVYAWMGSPNRTYKATAQPVTLKEQK